MRAYKICYLMDQGLNTQRQLDSGQIGFAARAKFIISLSAAKTFSQLVASPSFYHRCGQYAGRCWQTTGFGQDEANEEECSIRKSPSG